MVMEMAKRGVTLESGMVPIDALKLRRDLYPRAEMSEEAVERYRDCLDEIDPVTVARSDAESLNNVVIDGTHTLEAYKRQRKAVVPCRFLEVRTDIELLVEAARRNVRHGLPLTLAERRSVATTLWRADVSEKDIAAAVGRSPRTVGAWLQELKREETKNLKAEASRLKQAGLSTRKIGQKLGRDHSRIVRWLNEDGAESQPCENAPASEKEEGLAASGNAEESEEGGERKRAGGSEPKSTEHGQLGKEIEAVVAVLQGAQRVVSDLMRGKPCRPSDSAIVMQELGQLEDGLQGLRTAERVESWGDAHEGNDGVEQAG